MTPDEFKTAAFSIVDWIGSSCGASKITWHKYHCSFLVHELATWDRDALTQLVIACHKRCIRAEISNGGPRRLKVTLSARERTDPGMPIMHCHPTIEQAIRRFETGCSVHVIADWMNTLDPAGEEPAQ